MYESISFSFTFINGLYASQPELRQTKEVQTSIPYSDEELIKSANSQISDEQYYVDSVTMQSDTEVCFSLKNKDYEEIIYVFLTIFLYLLKCPQSLILSALRAFCFCGKPHISRSIFLYFRYQSWLKSW